MQSELLDITIIGCLVLLFGSTYRKRPSRIVRAWLAGWILILLHFAALLFHPAGVAAARIVTSVSLAALFACGVVFLLAPPRERQRDRGAFVLMPVFAGFASVVCIALQIFDVSSEPTYFLLGSLGAGAWVVYVLGRRSESLFVSVLLLVSVILTSSWFYWAIWHRQFELVPSALLTQIFILVGITYIGTFRRISAGTLTVSLGLLAWAAVFPVAEFLEHLQVGGHVHPEFWNIPKYFVAFGMLLMLLEEEILVANEAGKTLHFRANHDQLTGLRNRSALEQDLRQAVELAGLAEQKCALICLDLDRFKQINDTYGHGIGDICLQIAGERLARFGSDGCTAARIGGEEFGLVLGEIADLEEAESVARQVQLALRAPICAEGVVLEVTASVGIAIFPDDGNDPATLWRNADCVMYRAKRAGGNQIVSMSPEIFALTSEFNDMELSLRSALRESGLELRFQPIFQADGQIHSVEALARLDHPELGLILPDRFIPVAEERGLIVPLGDWVFRKVCTQHALWASRGVPPVLIAMNISALQITSSTFAAGVLEILSEFGIDPSSIAMEITETAMLRNIVEASRQIDLLAAAGVRFSVDDFGIGYSSFGQLDKLDVDYLKIDRSFVDRMCSVDEARAIVSAIISMAHGLGLKVIAEGVEEECSFDYLREMNCDLFQGFFFGQPLTGEEVERLLLAKKTGAEAPPAGAQVFAGPMS